MNANLYVKKHPGRWLFFIVVILAQACASKGNTGKRVELGRVVDQPLALIATDLVGALVQIPKYSRGSTVFQPIIVSEFDKAVHRALQENGLTVINTKRRVGLDLIFAFEEAGVEQQTLIIRIGEVAIKRSYSVQDNKVTPASSLFVRGINSNKIRLDDRKFLPSTRISQNT